MPSAVLVERPGIHDFKDDTLAVLTLLAAAVDEQKRTPGTNRSELAKAYATAISPDNQLALAEAIEQARVLPFGLSSSDALDRESSIPAHQLLAVPLARLMTDSSYGLQKSPYHRYFLAKPSLNSLQVLLPLTQPALDNYLVPVMVTVQSCITSSYIHELSLVGDELNTTDVTASSTYWSDRFAGKNKRRLTGYGGGAVAVPGLAETWQYRQSAQQTLHDLAARGFAGDADLAEKIVVIAGFTADATDSRRAANRSVFEFSAIREAGQFNPDYRSTPRALQCAALYWLAAGDIRHASIFALALAYCAPASLSEEGCAAALDLADDASLKVESRKALELWHYDDKLKQGQPPRVPRERLWVPSAEYDVGIVDLDRLD